MLISDNAQARGKHIDGLGPGCGLQLPFLANKRRAQSLRTVDELEAPASPVAQPAIIDGIIGARHQPHDLIYAHIYTRITAHAAVVAHAGNAFQLPGARLEAIRARSQRTHRAYLNGVSRKDRVKG